MKTKVLLTFRPTPQAMIVAEKNFEVIRDAGDPDTARVLTLATEHRPAGLLVANGQIYDAATIAQLPASVKIIATCSVGFEHIDVAACAGRGIIVTNTPDVLTEACADLALFVMLGAARRGKEALKLVEKGWGTKLQQGDLLGLDLRGKRLGILGMGRIGQAVAHRARAFGMKILYSNRHRLPPEQELDAKYFAGFHELLPQCDFLSLHAPGGPDTKGLMGAREFALLPEKAVFVNISRGSLVDEEALITALESKKLFAAGLDVCLNEPNPDLRLLRMPNVFLTPHIASATEETRQAMFELCLANLRAVFQDQSAPNIVQPKER